MSQEQNKKRPMMGHGPGRGMMPGEKAKDFTGTIQKLFAYLGSYRIVLGVVILFAIGSTVFNIIGPKVLSKVTTELFNGLVAKVSGTGGIDFEKIGRILLLDRPAARHRQHRFCVYRPHPAVFAGDVPAEQRFQLYSGLADDRRDAEAVLSDAKGNFRKNQPDADEIFRIQNGRRSAFENHERCRYAGTELKPKRDPVNYLDCDDDRRVDQSYDDADRTGDSANFRRFDRICGQTFPEIFRGAAELSR